MIVFGTMGVRTRFTKVESDHGFYDLLSLTSNSVIDSHSCAAGISPHSRNLSDHRIGASAERGGVVGVSFRAALVNQHKEMPDIRDLLAHIDYIVELAGVEHVALGPDYSAYNTPVDRNRIRGFGNLGPDFCAFDRRTPLQSEKYPGWIEGIWYGTRPCDFVSGVDEHEAFPHITEALIEHGYSNKECRMILGENFLRAYRAVLS